MSPFRVQCETCQARLLIRDAKLIGQIHGCPKCGGMVCLTPPVDWSEAPAEASEEASAPADLAHANPTPADFAPPEELLSPPQQAAAELTPPPAPAPDVPASEAVSQWALIAAAAGGIAVLLAGAGLFLLSGGDDPPQQTVATSEPLINPPIETAKSTESDTVTALKPPVIDVADLSQPPADDSEAFSLQSTIGAESSSESDISAHLPTDVGDDSALPKVSDLPQLPPAPDSDVSAESDSPRTSQELPTEEELPTATQPIATKPIAGSVNRPFDPLDFDPSALDLILTRGGKTAAPSEPVIPATEPEAEEFDLPEPEPQPEVQIGNDLNARLEKMAAAARAVVRRGPTGPAPEEPTDPLAVEVADIQIADQPLADVVRLLSKIAGTPFTIDPTALRIAGVAATKPVALGGNNSTVGKLIDQALTPIRLELNRQGSAYILARIGSSNVRQASYRVADLLPAGSPDALPLIELLEPMLTTGGTAGTISTDGRKVQVDGPGRLHLEFAVLCERLRKARGLSLASRYPKELIQIKPLLSSMQSVLDRRTTFTFADFSPLAEVIAHWRSSTGLEILVDWASLADNDLTPTSTIACSVNDRPWQESLDAVLGGLDLTWMPAAPNTLWITTNMAGQGVTRVEFYPVSSPDHAAELIGKLTTADALRYDEPSGTVLALGNEDMHREAELAVGEN